MNLLPEELSSEIVLLNGKIVTVDSENSIAEAVTVKDGKILMVGSNEKIEKSIGEKTKVIDLDGKTVLPGFNDSHQHPGSYGLLLTKFIDLNPSGYSLSYTNVTSISELLQKIEERVEKTSDGKWIIARGLDDKKLGRYPTIGELDKVAPNNPVYIVRRDGHIGFINSKAAEVANITSETPDPPYGKIDRDPQTGKITGLLRERAKEIVTKILPPDTLGEYTNGLEAAFKEYLRLGITTIHSSITPSILIKAFSLLRENNKLPLRVGIIVSGEEEGLLDAYIKAGIRTGFGDDWLRIIGIECCPDTSTSGRTAAYYEPYVGDPVPGEPSPNYGIMMWGPDKLNKWAIKAHKAGLRLGMDGVGDRGIDVCLDAMEAALKEKPETDHRMRIEHCCYVTPSILKRLKKLGVIDSSAVGFMYDLGDAYKKNRGANSMKWMWPHKSLINAEIPAPAHSDCPVCNPNPLLGIYSLVNRKSDTGNDMDISQAITIIEAIRAYTIDGAYAEFQEKKKGSIEPGKLADMIVLSDDILTIPKEKIKNITIELTIVDGDIKYSKNKI